MRTPRNRFRVAVFALATLVGGCSAVFAQAPPGQQQPPPQPRSSSGPHEGFGIQLAGGPLFANLTDVKGFNTGNKTGWLAGLALGGNRGGVLGVEADVLYGEKGATVNSQDFKQHVVDVPVMLKINVGSSNVNGLSVFVSGGTYFDWLFNSKLNDVDVSKDTDGYEVGWLVGGGVEILRFSVQARYIRGLTEINRELTNLNPIGDAKGQTFLVLFAFRLN
jgi:Outer membrane protein beta-barrel domain